MKKTMYAKLVALLLVVTLLTGCGLGSGKLSKEAYNYLKTLGWVIERETNTTVEVPTTEPGTIDPGTDPEPGIDPVPPSSNGEYDFSIYDDSRTYTADELEVQDEFDEWLTDYFMSDLTASYLNLIYSVEDPEAFGITDYEVSWGDNSIESIQAYESDVTDLYNELLEFDYYSLDYEGQLIYDTMSQYLLNEITGAKYWYFSESFSPLDGIQTSIPILLAEIQFYDVDDIDNYLAFMADTPRFIDELIAIENYRSENYGIFLSNDAADEVIVQCNDFINSEDNVLITTFNERIDSFSGLTDEEKDTYKALNETYVNDYIIEPFNDIVTMLTELKGTRLYNSLSEYEHGSDYYAYLVKANSSSLADVSDLMDLAEDYFNTANTKIEEIASGNYSAVYEFLYPTYPEEDPVEALNFLADALTQDFPTPATTEFDLKYVPESLESSSSPAFYIIAPIDNIDKNIIYINGSDEYADTDLFPILAHEGFPGHLYQNTYFTNLNPHLIRTSLSFIGYTEGFAMYSERYSYKYSGFSSDCVELFQYNDIFGYGIYSYIDLKVNYEGWTYDEVETYLDSLGYASAAEELYSIAINDPCVYHRYFIGLVQYVELQEYAKTLLGSSYTNKNFNKFMLEIGPTYFEIIEDRMVDWADLIN